jgi:hypothetical protein
MTRPESNPRVDALLRSLPREVEPGRDLWPAIESRLDARSTRRRPAWALQAAAAVVLVASSSLVTAVLVRHEGASSMGLAARTTAVPVVPAVYGRARMLDAGYEAARRQLAADIEQRLAGMPDSARLKLEANLAEMHRAAQEINAALARQPGDPLLEELLLNTYQDELGVLASVNQLTSTGATSAPTRQEKIRL